MPLSWRKHPILKPPTADEMARMEPEKLIELYEVYHSAIENAEKDPYRYGFSLPHWEYADRSIEKFRTTVLFGSNRSGKTSYSSRLVVRCAVDNPNSLIYCFSQNKEISVLVQQSAIYNWLPAEYKRRMLSSVGNINYSFKNGFTDNTLVLPNGSKIIFKFYTQWLQDDTILEGMELGCREPTTHNIGAWLDEYLLGMDLIDRLYLRLATFNAKLLISFTPKDGETETVKNYRQKAVTIESKFVSEGLSQPRRVPYYQENKAMNTGICYFHSKDNPWSGYETLLEQCLNKGEDDYTLTALYGVPTKNISTKFPRFQPELNVLKDEVIKERIKGCTHYMVLDPAGSKPWFMCWIAVDPTDTWYVYREWPDSTHGDWAVERGGKWAQGDACKQKLGYGVKEYVELIRMLEEGQVIFERIIDPRMGASKYSSKTGGQSDYITDLRSEGGDDFTFIPAPGIEEEPGIQAIQDKLAYNTDKPIDANNRPHFYISDRCENIILALQEYDASSREHPLKDPIDCYDAETEVLTERGWERFADYRGGRVATMAKNGSLEWQEPTEVISRHHSGKMIALETTRASFCVTPNHRMYVYPQRNRLTVRCAKDLCRQDTIPLSTKGINQQSPSPASDVLWFEFLGWYLGDGSATSNMGGGVQIPGRGYSVYISQSRTANAEKCRRIEFVLDGLGFRWAYRAGSYVISNKELWLKLMPLGNCYTKRIPDFAYTAPKDCIQAMLYGLQESDGWTSGGKMRYCSVSKELTDGVQALMMIAGMRAGGIYEKAAEKCIGGVAKGRAILGTTNQYWVSEIDRDRLSITNNQKEYLPREVDYDGMVYCLSVPNQTLIVRRNGKPMVCGNCLRYAAVDQVRYIDQKAFTMKSNKKAGY